jgi:superfamily I DNA and RNA helicase
VAAEIKKNLQYDELEHEDVLVVFPEAYTLSTEAAIVSRALQALGIASHVAGVTRSQDELFHKRSVAICHIHRAKGNEAPVVYVMNAQECYAGPELTRRRNTLFTAITRSRAWVRIVGVGPKMDTLAREIDEVRKNNYQLIFKVPTEAEINRLRTIHRDMSEAERAKLRKVKQKLEETRRLLTELDLEEMPPDLLEQLEKLRELGRGANDAS